MCSGRKKFVHSDGGAFQILHRFGIIESDHEEIRRVRRVLHEIA